ncbi:MAG: CatB-related O-acetyltransferase [Bacteroidales bacterium]|nr:CatB-related O-acetyltransferase [Bacteroidales bacterium]
MLNYLRQYIYQKYLSYRYNIKFGKNCIINKRNTYEGYNAIYNNTKVTNSFLGYGSYIASNSNLNYTKIGRFCAVGENVKTFLGIHPSSYFVSIHPAFYSTKKQAGFSFVKEDRFQEHKFINDSYVVDIGNDVWIGNNVIIMDGIKIGDGAIIATGSIVTSNVPEYAIIAGVPAKIIKYRFEKDQIKFLANFIWWNKDPDWIRNNAEIFSSIEIFTHHVKK